jgi:hypothetical protein
MRISLSKGAGVFFFKRLNGDVLVALGKRNEPSFKGFWSFAGGNFDNTDMDGYFNYINQILTDLYNLPAYDWKQLI